MGMPEQSTSQQPIEVVRKAWAETIRLERHRQRRLQIDVAEAAGVNQSTVVEAERGKASLETFLSIAAALGVTLVEVEEPVA